MTIENEPNPGAESTILGVPEITTQEELDRLLKGDEPPVNPPSKKPATPAKPGAATPPPAEDGEEGEDGEGEEGEQDEQDPVQYPTIIHALNAQHELGLNLEDGQQMTPEEQTEVLSELITRMTDGTNQAISQYQYIEQLLLDPEVKRVLEAKAQNKSLKDIVSEFAITPQGMNDDELVANDFKKRYPKATPEMISSMIEPLKKNGQFAAFATGLREQSIEEQRLSTEQAERLRVQQEQARQLQDQEELQRYVQFVGNQNAVYGVPLTNEMKQHIIQMTTVRNEKGETYLDQALQSDEGTVLAILGIAYMKDLIANGGSLIGNKKNQKFMNKIFQRPDALQSSGGGNKIEEFDPSLANKF